MSKRTIRTRLPDYVYLDTTLDELKKAIARWETKYPDGELSLETYRSYNDDYEWALYQEREETDEEYAERVQVEQLQAKKDEDKRRELFLKLQKEFT